MKILAWASTPDLKISEEKCKYLIETSQVYHIPVEIMGLGYNYRFLKDKLYILQQHLKKIEDNILVTCIDGFDTVINSSLDNLDQIFNSFNTKIVISSEKIFTYQWGHYKDKFDQLTSPYKYVNSGTITGRVGDIKNMLKEIFSYPELEITEIDQGLVGAWVYKNMDDPSEAKLDTECKITWVTSGEWGALKEISQQNPTITHPTLHHQPPIIHIPGSQDKFNYSSYVEAYKNIINR